MTAADWKTRAETIERFIRSGKLTAVQPELEGLAGDEIPRDLLPRYAALARRAGLPMVALQWLLPLVSPGKGPPTATETERIEYAACLIRVGAQREPVEILSQISREDFPRVDFEMAAAHIAEWRYAEAAPLLDRYIRDKRTAPYERLIAKVNYAAALVNERDDMNATVWLRELTHETSLEGNELLFGNVMQLSAMLFLMRRKGNEMGRFLDEAEKRLQGGRALDAFFVRKWRALLFLLQKGASAAAEVRIIGQEADKLGHWETCRDCDRFLSLLTADARVLKKIYFGTPYPSFRRRLLRDFGQSVEIESEYVWAAGPVSAAKVLDTARGACGGASLESSPALIRLLGALAADFYRPARIATLFEALHPNESFHPTNSTSRIHQSVQGLRAWLEKHAPGISLTDVRGEYRLFPSAGWGVHVVDQKASLAPDPETVRLDQLRELFGTQAFDPKQAAAALGISVRAVQALLTHGQESEKLVRLGPKGSAKYRFHK